MSTWCRASRSAAPSARCSPSRCPCSTSAASRSTLGEPDQALGLAQSGSDLAHLIGAHDLEAAALVTVGFALLELERPGEARAAFARSNELFIGNGSPHYGLEPLLGEALVDLVEDDLASAKVIAERILEHLAGGDTLAFLEEPSRSDDACYRVLRAADDERREILLGLADEQLIGLAETLDESDRHRFLDLHRYNRRIVDGWSAIRAS